MHRKARLRFNRVAKDALALLGTDNDFLWVTLITGEDGLRVEPISESIHHDLDLVNGLNGLKIKLGLAAGPAAQLIKKKPATYLRLTDDSVVTYCVGVVEKSREIRWKSFLNGQSSLIKIDPLLSSLRDLFKRLGVLGFARVDIVALGKAVETAILKEPSRYFHASITVSSASRLLLGDPKLLNTVLQTMALNMEDVRNLVESLVWESESDLDLERKARGAISRLPPRLVVSPKIEISERRYYPPSSSSRPDPAMC